MIKLSWQNFGSYVFADHSFNRWESSTDARTLPLLIYEWLRIRFNSVQFDSNLRMWIVMKNIYFESIAYLIQPNAINTKPMKLFLVFTMPCCLVPNILNALSNKTSRKRNNLETPRKSSGNKNPTASIPFKAQNLFNFLYVELSSLTYGNYFADNKHPVFAQFTIVIRMRWSNINSNNNSSTKRVWNRANSTIVTARYSPLEALSPAWESNGS